MCGESCVPLLSAVTVRLQHYFDLIKPERMNEMPKRQ